jgi:hypothetical protein
MLTAEQISELEVLVDNNPRMSGKQMLAYLKSNMIHPRENPESPMKDEEKLMGKIKSPTVKRKLQGCVHNIHDGKANDATHESEMKKGVKVMTPERSIRGQKADPMG